MEKYDLIVIGCGPAGFSAAMRAYDFKKKVLIVEANEIGGYGVVNGALTSKTMWELSKDYSVAAAVNRGYRASKIDVDYSEVRDTVLNAARERQYQMLSQIETFSKDEKGKGSVRLKRGRARFLSNTAIEIEHEGVIEKVESTYFLISTGSRPRHLPGIEVDQKQIIDSDGIMGLKKFPKRMMIIGAGIIGCEFATIFSNFGQTDVHLLDKASRIIPAEDDDISNLVSSNLKNKGTQIYHDARLREIRKVKDYLEVVIDFQDGHTTVVEVDLAMLSIGRVPNTDMLGLEKTDVELNDRGQIIVDNHCRSSVKNIFAAGDTSGQAPLVSVAELEGRYAAKAMFEMTKYPLNYDNMSTLMFFSPEVAAVGHNEQSLRAAKIPYRVATYSYKLVSRAIAMRNTDGFFKIIVSEDDENKLLGMRSAGPHSSATILSLASLMDQGNKLDDVMRTTHPHPSITEGVQECLRVLLNKSVFKPEAFPDLIKINTWRPQD